MRKSLRKAIVTIGIAFAILYTLSCIEMGFMLDPIRYAVATVQFIGICLTNPILLMGIAVYFLLISLHELIHYIYLLWRVPESNPKLVMRWSIIAMFANSLNIIKLRNAGISKFVLAIILPSVILLPICLWLDTTPLSYQFAGVGLWLWFLILSGIIPLVLPRYFKEELVDHGSWWYRHIFLQATDYAYCLIGVCDELTGSRILDYMQKQLHSDKVIEDV